MAVGGIFISSLTNTMLQLQTFYKQKMRKFLVIQEYCQEHNISTCLSVRIKKSVEKSFERKMREQYAIEMAEMLPWELLTDLRYESWSPTLFEHCFFKFL